MNTDKTEFYEWNEGFVYCYIQSHPPSVREMYLNIVEWEWLSFIHVHLWLKAGQELMTCQRRQTFATFSGS